MDKYVYDCSLIIPTHNNHSYLSRSFEYYKSLKMQVVCLDSSEAIYTDYVPSNIKYIHLPKYSFVEKMLYALEILTTKYVACSPDDDFIILDALYNGLNNMLDNNIIATVGKYLAFSKPFNGQFFPIYTNNGWNYIDGDNNNNIYSFMSNYHMILWGLYDKEILLIAYKTIEMAKIKNDNFIEFILGITLSYYGKILFLDQIWGVREIKQEDSWGRRHSSICEISKEDMNTIHKEVEQAIIFYTNTEGFKSGYSGYLAFCKSFNTKKNLFRKIKDKLSRILKRKPIKHQIDSNLKLIASIISKEN